jgi:hypothetical protein
MLLSDLRFNADYLHLVSCIYIMLVVSGTIIDNEPFTPCIYAFMISRLHMSEQVGIAVILVLGSALFESQSGHQLS